ncbi:unnamed protein product [Prorocentrum cordatum]|uniref:Anaphase-promoting complex subunit 1 n=1 Tax=Prorocentrum cordatum TaxID=2364126 RepID=A0ABN9QSC8_9DINO|nr:unnamed protein product [Polarella glacialis]
MGHGCLVHFCSSSSRGGGGGDLPPALAALLYSRSPPLLSPVVPCSQLQTVAAVRTGRRRAFVWRRGGQPSRVCTAALFPQIEAMGPSRLAPTANTLLLPSRETQG